MLSVPFKIAFLKMLENQILLAKKLCAYISRNCWPLLQASLCFPDTP
jgi:hypothetical protein